MHLADLSSRLRRLHVMNMLAVALQDITAPTPTIEIARMIARRLDTNEVQLIGRIIVSMAPHMPQARKGSTTFRQYGREMRPWIWSPMASKVAAPVVAAEPDDDYPRLATDEKVRRAAADMGVTVEEYRALVAGIELAPSTDETWGV